MIQPKFSWKRVLLALGALLTLTLSYANGFATLPTDEANKRCLQERYQKMLGYNCANLNLKQIPQYLKSSLLIFDLSFNRIRDLNRQSFARYTDVKYLYLFENMIQNIEEGTFSELTSLEALDLSNNALLTIPMEILRLPMLRNLYVAHNALHDLEDDLQRMEKPIGAPLQILSLADCWLKRLPDFGILPDLWQLNISSNPMTQLSVEQFAPMCNLKTVDLNNTQMAVCTCQSITAELSARRTVILNLHPHCYIEQTSCAQDVTDSPPANAIEYQQCIDVLQTRKLESKAKTKWFAVLVGGLVCIVLAALILCCCHKRNKKSMLKEANKRLNATPINRVMVPSSDDAASSIIVENGNRDKLITDCD